MVNRSGTAIAMLLATALSMPTYASVLSAFEWTNRPLLIFANNTDDPKYVRSLKLLNSLQCELHERDMVIGQILRQGISSLDNKTLTDIEAEELRERFDIKEGHFTVLLIGKDGDEKYRSHSTAVMRQIFSLIDSMPMRQNEMHLQTTRC